MDKDTKEDDSWSNYFRESGSTNNKNNSSKEKKFNYTVFISVSLVLLFIVFIIFKTSSLGDAVTGAQIAGLNEMSNVGESSANEMSGSEKTLSKTSSSSKASEETSKTSETNEGTSKSVLPSNNQDSLDNLEGYSEGSDGSKEVDQEIILGTYSELLHSLIDLNDDMDNPVAKAQKITEINSLVQKIDNFAVANAWESFGMKLNGKSTVDDFFEFITIIAQEGQKDDLVYSNFIINFLIIDKYWNTDYVVEFSEALTMVNHEVENFNKVAISSKWEEILKCDGKCNEKNRLLFEIIGLVVKQ
ncbi:MAG: hypothetical protein ABH824_02840 [Nanoarchaeota archaeon]